MNRSECGCGGLCDSSEPCPMAYNAKRTNPEPTMPTQKTMIEVKLPLIVGPYYKTDIHDRNGMRIACGNPQHTDQGEYNAAEIVRIANSHAALVEALEMVLLKYTLSGADSVIVSAALASAKP